MRRFIIVFIASALLATSLLLVPGGQQPVDASDDGNSWFTTDGTHILDENGNKVWLTGANWFGFNCKERMLLDSYHSDIIAVMEKVADKGINVIRMPISTELMYSWSQGEYPPSVDTSYNNPILEGLNSFELFNLMLENIERLGMKVVLNVHSAETDNQGHIYPLWFKGDITEEVFQEAWVWMANEYKDNDTIIGFDLKNEPHTNAGNLKRISETAIWDDSDRPTNWKRAAQETALKVLEVHPNALIFIEGVEMYPKDHIWDEDEFNTCPWTGSDDYYGNWWGGNLRGVEKYPIDLGEHQNKLVYSPHDYGPIVYEQPWFRGEFVTADDERAKQIVYEECWRDNWGFIMEEGIAPLLLGEWGGMTEGDHELLDLNKKYLRVIVEYIQENKYSLHHTFWCINIDSADTGGLLCRDHGSEFPGGRDLKWNDDKYDNYLLPVLWQNDEGKFIGLDQNIPLGSNGISLGEHYGTGSGSTPEPEEPTPTPTPEEPTPEPEEPIKYGDLNEDGKIDSTDAALLSRILLEIPTPTINEEAADLNNDGIIDSSDYVILQRYIFGTISELPLN
ncbi:cellulase family glycosylhydrolase [Herbivorax sp. ANBcel31]|uniref:cellulase family glycosylhydrolase n=1 Tax=Herbivorax sp. ANBcel31 TaxID=3069754 RepID=UPI0027B19C98|nr:cellulase family glycosylhydrolase [Herbivorax sp. ANBcel31]MDQ2087474.1 cellulase family glycosylhydrolase [Herbivorax sp. ANBcel31]